MGGGQHSGKGLYNVYSILHTILPNWKILTCCPLAAHMTSQRPCCHSRMPAVQKIMKQNKCVGKLIQHKSSLGISVSGKIQEEPVSGFRSHIRADAPSERRAAHVVKGHHLSLSSNWDRPCTFKGAKLIFIFGASVCPGSWDSSAK